MIANDIKEKLVIGDAIREINVVGAYINFFVNQGNFTESVLTKVLAEGTAYGHSTLGAGKAVVVDYSSPNIAKPFHVGHLRSTVIGNAICKIHQALGYTVEGVNHLGDWVHNSVN